MKKNDVIFYKRAFFLITKVDVENAHINKIRDDGLVLSLAQKIPLTTKVQKIEGAKRKIVVLLPVASVNEYKYENMISEARRCVYNILTDKERDKNMGYLRHLAFRSCMLRQKGGFRDLAYFSKRIGLKVPDKLYEYLANTITSDIKARKGLIKDLSDKALNNVLSNYLTFWECWYGVHPQLDKALKADFKLHMGEMNERSKNALLDEDT
jgi:hypothetical protein